MSYPTDCIPAQIAQDLANKDISRLVGDITKFMPQSDPYMGMVGVGTLPNVSDDVRFVVQERALPGASLVRPSFVADATICGTSGLVTRVGSTEFTVSLGTLRERGPLTCIRVHRTAWPGSYQSLVDSLKMSMRDVISADVRANLLDLSGLKLTASTSGFAASIVGDINTVGVNFPSSPTAGRKITFAGLEYLGSYMREYLGVEPYEGDMEEGSLLAIFGHDVINQFRDETNIRADIGSLTTGKYQMGEETITSYRFKGPYHGISLGVDHRPLRFSTYTSVANGGTDPRTGIVNTGAAYKVPNLIEPFVAVSTTKGTAGRPNPLWADGTYEIGFLFGRNSFKRLVPESYATPGFDFHPILSNQGLKFKVLEDADCNFWGDYGQHRYELSRAYQPQHPHAVCAIAFARCGPVKPFDTCPS